MEGERAPIPTTVSVLSNADDDDEDTINRTWILLCVSLVLAPGTGNTVPFEYPHTLQDMSVVHEFEWDEHILLDAMKEVKKYQDKRNEGKLKFHIGGCLPMLPVLPFIPAASPFFLFSGAYWFYTGFCASSFL